MCCDRVIPTGASAFVMSESIWLREGSSDRAAHKDGCWGITWEGLFFLIWKFTYRKIDRFRASDSVAFSVFTMWCNHHLCLILKHVLAPRETCPR